LNRQIITESSVETAVVSSTTENKITDDVLNITLDLFRTLESQGVRHCHWKSNQHLDDALAGRTDIDLLVDDKQAGLCEAIIKKAGYKRFISPAWSNYPGIEDWIGFDHESGNLAHLHLHYHIVTGKKYVKELRLGFEKLILDTAVKESRFDVFITNPNLEIVLLIIRIGLKTSLLSILSALPGKNPLPFNIMQELNYLLAWTDELQVKKFATEILSEKISEEIITMIRAANIESPVSILKIKTNISILLNRKRRFSRSRSSIIYCKHIIISRLAKFVGKLNSFGHDGKPGKRLAVSGSVIAVIGSDGSGKSTISSELKKWLSWKIETRKVYLGSGDGPVGLLTRSLQKLALLASSKQNNLQTAQQVQQKKSRKSNSFLRDFGFCLKALSLANERLRKLEVAARGRQKGIIYITDRFPQHQYSGIYDGPRILSSGNDRKIRRIFAARERKKYQEMEKFPADLIIKLHIPPEVAMQRKSDHAMANISRKTEITQQLIFPKSTVVDIDASQPLDDVLLAVKRTVWETL